MANMVIDTSEWEYLRSCADKVHRIREIFKENGSEKKVNHGRANEKLPAISAVEKLHEIAKLLEE